MRFSESTSSFAYLLSRTNGAYVDGFGIEILGGANGSEDFNVITNLNLDLSDSSSIEISHRNMQKAHTARARKIEAATSALLISSLTSRSSP